MKGLIFITIDSLRPDFLHCYGHPLCISPNIDKLAQKGIIFENAFSSGPSTSLSFPPILTRRCALSIPSFSPSGLIDISRIKPYLPEVLHQYNYETAAFLSYNPYISSLLGYNRGFDVFLDFIPYKDIAAKRRLKHILDSIPFMDLIRAIKDALHALCYHGGNEKYDMVCVKKAADWIRQRERKFFCWIHFMSAHIPYTYWFLGVKDRLKARFLTRKIISATKGATQRFTDAEVEILKMLYIGSILLIDYFIGQLLSTIDDKIRKEDIIVIIAADHGEGFGEHGELGHPKKLYDELIHVPLIIWGSTLTGKRIRQVTSLSELPSIMLQLLNIPKKIFGQSPLVTEVMDQKAVISEYRTFGSKEVFGWTLRTCKWKLIMQIKGKEVLYELYSLEKDPNEIENLANTYPELVRELGRKLHSHIMWEKILRTQEKLHFLMARSGLEKHKIY